MRWDHGKAACEAIGGHLPKVTESGLQTQILKLVGAIRSEVGAWIGQRYERFLEFDQFFRTQRL